MGLMCARFASIHCRSMSAVLRIRARASSRPVRRSRRNMQAGTGRLLSICLVVLPQLPVAPASDTACRPSIDCKSAGEIFLPAASYLAVIAVLLSIPCSGTRGTQRANLGRHHSSIPAQAAQDRPAKQPWKLLSRLAARRPLSFFSSSALPYHLHTDRSHPNVLRLPAGLHMFKEQACTKYSVRALCVLHADVRSKYLGLLVCSLFARCRVADILHARRSAKSPRS